MLCMDSSHLRHSEFKTRLRHYLFSDTFPCPLQHKWMFSQHLEKLLLQYLFYFNYESRVSSQHRGSEHFRVRNHILLIFISTAFIQHNLQHMTDAQYKPVHWINEFILLLKPVRNKLELKKKKSHTELTDSSSLQTYTPSIPTTRRPLFILIVLLLRFMLSANQKVKMTLNTINPERKYKFLLRCDMR